MLLDNPFGRTRQIVQRHGGWRSAISRLRQILQKEGVAGIVWRARFLLGARNSPNLESPSSAIHRDVGATMRGGVRSVMLTGHPYLVSGRGEDVRTGARAFATTDVSFGLCNTFPWGAQNAAMYADFPLVDLIDEPMETSVNIFFLNADEMASAHHHLGKRFFEGKYNIGYWAWELSEFPDAWCDAFRYVQEIWAPSRFTMEAIARKATCPVIHMPLPVELPALHGITRQDLDLPENGFLFLFFFDFSSFMNRKNPWAVIKAFERAFQDLNHHAAYLVVKLNGGHLRPDDYRQFLAEVASLQSNVRLIDKVLNARSMSALMNACDCFVSLHRAEGFGRGPAEAMCCGKPVIVTGYSGNMDFTNEANACIVDYQLIPVGPAEYPFGEGQKWADADVEQAAWYMRRVYEDAKFREQIARAGKHFISANHSFSAVGSRYRRRLSRLN